MPLGHRPSPPAPASSPERPGPPVPGGFAVVDVEATGRSPWRHRVVEVAVVLLDHRLGAEGEFSTLIDPAGPVGPTHVHRITQDEVAGAPRFRDVAPALLELLAGRVLVGHHVSCDRAFLEREFARIGVVLPAVPELCTMRLARAHLPGAGGYGLAACAAAAGLGWYPAHTALGDARATAELLRRCVATPPPADALAARTPAPPTDRTPAPPADRATSPAADRPADWSAPLREAALLSWPRLDPDRAERPGGLVPQIRRTLPSAPPSAPPSVPPPAGPDGHRPPILAAGGE
ncbi:exonuclease domain-containing protein [Kitasatospora sp. NPDC094015]|uniref:3'-5' exonuclease n=1 Tax=Kitasatospora sp. NPDC094015 TaxID=3155205 RepID=UPI00332286EA